MPDLLLELKNVTKVFKSDRNRPSIGASDVCMSLEKNNPITLAIAGESGSGKTTLANLILNFHKPTSGEILYKGKNIQKMNGADFQQYRREVQAVFQNPFEAFNPFYPVDHVFHLVINKFCLASGRKEARMMINDSLEQVRLEPKNILGKYINQLSGGQLQRIMIARTLLLNPAILIADEPVSMIDASLRIVVLDVMEKIKKDNGITQIYITHDLSTALQISDRIMVMYHGSVVEEGNAEKVIHNPKHPYTKLLIQCIPQPSPDEKWDQPLVRTARETEKNTPYPCCFYGQCPEASPGCLSARPPLVHIEPDHLAACGML
jgi:peptide/nickel transport system ATP-binding protein